jgi:hypothetical protein
MALKFLEHVVFNIHGCIYCKLLYAVFRTPYYLSEKKNRQVGRQAGRQKRARTRTHAHQLSSKCRILYPVTRHQQHKIVSLDSERLKPYG